MIDILASVSRQKAVFMPRDLPEFFALQLARAMSDMANLPSYIRLARDYPDAVLSAAFRRLPLGDSNSRLERLEDELKRGRVQGAKQDPPVLGIRLERRVMALVLLSRGRIERSETRELSWKKDQALSTVEALLHKSLPWIDASTIAVENLLAEGDIQRKALYEAATAVLRSHGLPIWEVSRADALAAFGEPSPKTLHAMRSIAGQLWPAVTTLMRSGALLDAAALAAFVHAARQLTRIGNTS